MVFSFASVRRSNMWLRISAVTSRMTAEGYLSLSSIPRAISAPSLSWVYMQPVASSAAGLPTSWSRAARRRVRLGSMQSTA